MDSLDLDVEHGVGVDIDSTVFLDPFGQSLLVVELDSSPLGAEVSIFSLVFKFSESWHVQDPLVSSQGLGVEIRLLFISTDDPSSDGNSVGNVHELVREDFNEVVEKGSPHQLRV